MVRKGPNARSSMQPQEFRTVLAKSSTVNPLPAYAQLHAKKDHSDGGVRRRCAMRPTPGAVEEEVAPHTRHLRLPFSIVRHTNEPSTATPPIIKPLNVALTVLGRCFAGDPGLLFGVSCCERLQARRRSSSYVIISNSRTIAVKPSEVVSTSHLKHLASRRVPTVLHNDY